MTSAYQYTRKSMLNQMDYKKVVCVYRHELLLPICDWINYIYIGIIADDLDSRRRTMCHLTKGNQFHITMQQRSCTSQKMLSNKTCVNMKFKKPLHIIIPFASFSCLHYRMSIPKLSWYSNVLVANINVNALFDGRHSMAKKYDTYNES